MTVTVTAKRTVASCHGLSEPLELRNLEIVALDGLQADQLSVCSPTSQHEVDGCLGRKQVD